MSEEIMLDASFIDELESALNNEEIFLSAPGQQTLGGDNNNGNNSPHAETAETAETAEAVEESKTTGTETGIATEGNEESHPATSKLPASTSSSSLAAASAPSSSAAAGGVGVGVNSHSSSTPSNASSKTTLIAWFIAQADIPSSRASVYADLLVHSGVLTIKKLVKNIKKNKNYLTGIGLAEIDSTAIIAALIKENYLDAEIGNNVNLENDQLDATGTAAAGAMTATATTSDPSIPMSSHDLEKAVKDIRKMLQEVIDAPDSFIVEKLAKDACKEIVTVASNSYEGQLALGKIGICEDLVVIITIYTPSSPRVLQRALCALCALCRRKMDDRTTQCTENITLLGEVRACQATISALRKYEDNLVIIKWAAGAIRNLCSLDLNRTRFGTSGACQSLMQIARRYETNEDVLRWIFRAMGNLVNGNNANRTSLIHHGFCDFVIPSMKSHSKNALVLADSCWAIRSVALGDQGCRNQLVELKACEIIAENLKVHYQVDFLISEACLAFLALLTDSEVVMTRLAQEGACTAFTFPLLGTNDTTQFSSISHTNCCGEIAAVECLTAIHGLAINDRIRNYFFDAGAGEACGCALRCHPHSAEVAVWVCKALYKLSTSSSSAKKLKRTRVCESLATLLSNELPSTHPEVAEWAGLCVSMLAIDKTNREILAKNNICVSIVKLLQIHQNDADVAYRMCGAIHFLSIDDSIRSQLGELGACEIVTSVLRIHTTRASSLPTGTMIHEGAVQASSRALGSLASENIENNIKFSQCQVAEVLMSAFNQFRGSPAMIEFCCRAISRVCINPLTLTTFSNLSGCQCIINAIIDYVETDAVVKHALLAAETLTNQNQTNIDSSLIIRENIRKFRDTQGCLVSIIRAFELHSSAHSLIAQTGSAVFRHLYSEISVNSTRSDSLFHKLSGDVCRVMISSMTPHLKIPTVQLEIISSIETVSKFGVPPIMLGQLNYLTLLLSTLVQHSTNSEVVQSIFLTIINLIEETDNVHYVCSVPGCNAILGSLRSQQNTPQLISIGCKLIEKLAQNDSYRNVLNATSTCEILTDILVAQCPPSTPNEDVLLAIFSTITTLCLLDRNTVSFSELPTFHDSLCSLLSDSSVSIKILEGCCRVLVIILAYARVPDQISLLADGDEESSRSQLRRTSSKPRMSQRPSLSQLNLISSRNTLTDEPSSGLSSSSPARRYHSSYLTEVVPHLFSQFSQNPVYSGSEPPIFRPHETYPNINKLLERKLDEIYGNLLLNHSENEVLVWLIFEGYSLLTLEEKGVKALTTISETNLCELICRVFGTYITKSERLESAGCKILTNIAIAHEGDYAELLGQLGACSLIPLYLKHYYTLSPEAVRIGCTTLAYLCKQNANNRISLAANGACEVIFSCLQKFIFNPLIVTQVIHSIKCLCSQNKINTTSFSSLGTLDFLIENLLGTEVLVGDNSLIGSTLWCIGHIPPAVLSHLWSLRVIEFVMNTFRDHFNDLTASALGENGYIVMSACEAVYTLCSYIENSRTVFAQYEICDVIISVLRYYDHDENILHSALMALANLLDRIPENQQKVQEVIILKTMQTSCQSLVVVRGSLAALLGVVHGNPTYPEKLSSVAAIKIILKGIFLHFGDVIVAKRGSSLLAILSSHDKIYQRVLGSEGACGIVLDIIKIHESNVTVMREACWALCCLCHHYDPNRSKILSLGGLEYFTSLLKLFSDNASILVWVCGTIANISAIHTSSNANQYLSVGTCGTLVEILQIYGLGGELGSENILKYICWSVANLALVNILSETLGDAGICEQLVLVLWKHLENSSVVEITLTTIKNLLKNVNNKKRFEESGLMDLLDQIIQKYSTNEEMIQNIRKIKNIFVPTKLFNFGLNQSGGSQGSGGGGGGGGEASGGESVSDDEK